MPSTRFEPSGTQCTTFTLAVKEPARDGSTKAFTLYVPCISWGKVAEAATDVQAEDLVSVEGKLTWRKTVDKEGRDKSTLAVSVRQVTVLAAAERLEPAHSATSG